MTPEELGMALVRRMGLTDVASITLDALPTNGRARATAWQDGETWWNGYGRDSVGAVAQALAHVMTDGDDEEGMKRPLATPVASCLESLMRGRDLTAEQLLVFFDCPAPLVREAGMRLVARPDVE